MKKVMQKADMKAIKSRIVHYFCDVYGKQCGTRDNPKETWYSSDDKEFHYCKKTKCTSKDNEINCLHQIL